MSPACVGVVGGDDVGCAARRAAALTSRRKRSTWPRCPAGRLDDLEGDRPFHELVFGLVHRTHAAGAEQAEQTVAGVVGELLRKP